MTTGQLHRAAIVAPTRTAVGSFGGGLRDVPVEDLAATVVRAVVDRSGDRPANASTTSCSRSPTRTPRCHASAAGRRCRPACRSSVPGMQLDRRCGGGLQAVVDRGDDGADRRRRRRARRRRGEHEQRRVLHHRHPLGRAARAPSRCTTASIAAASDPSRIERFGVISGHDRDRREPGRATTVSPARRPTPTPRAATSAPPRPGTTAGSTTRSCRCPSPAAKATRSCSPPTRACAPTRPSRSLGEAAHPEPDGVVTAGNASQQNDAAAACLVVAEDKLEPSWASSRSAASSRWAAAGCEPVAHGHRSGARRGAALRRAPASSCRRHRPGRTQRGIRRAGARRAEGLGLGRPRTGSTSTAPASRWATRSAPPAAGSWPPCCTSCAAAAADTAWRPCASAAARASPRCSKRHRRAAPASG